MQLHQRLNVSLTRQNTSYTYQRLHRARIIQKTPAADASADWTAQRTHRAVHGVWVDSPGARTSIVAQSVATESLTGRPVVLDSYDDSMFEPSNDLRELAAAQLHSLFQVLRRISPGSSGSCKACVYARRADSLDAPQMKLQRVCCKSAQQQQQQHRPGGFSSTSSTTSNSTPGSNNSFEELDEVLTLHRAAWEPGTSSSNTSSSSGCETEALLINEEIVLLPSSNLLVLPLAEAGVLVGLLVVEVTAKPGSPVPYQPQPLQVDPNSNNGDQQQQQQQTVWELPPVLGLSEDVLWALRMSVPPLAKACAMDLRTALAGAQQEARQRLARSLLLEARGPLKVLGTFGQMLSPRLKTGQTGEPESDMADGMLLQGQRLADVVAQLEAALRPAPRALGLPTGGLTNSSSSIDGSTDSASSSSSSWSAAVVQQQQPWREPLALPAAAAAAAAAAMDDGNMSDEDDSWAVADNNTQQQQQQQAGIGSSGSPAIPVASRAVQLPRVLQPSSSSSSRLLPPAKNQQVVTSQQQQQVVVDVDLVPGQHTGGSLESSSRDIRWSAVDAPRVLPAAAAPGMASSSSSSSLYAPAMGTFDAGKTIDLVEPQWAALGSNTSDSNSSSSDGIVQAAMGSQVPRKAAEASAAAAAVSGGSSTSSMRQQQQRRQRQTVVQRGFVCNVAEVLSHLLSAAAKLAQIQGVNLIVNDPLFLLDQQPQASSSSRSSRAYHSSSSSSGSSSTASMDSDGTSTSTSTSTTALALLPRPVRPLLVGVAGNVCRRVLGYCVDVALQCTPRGGQLCVTARASSGGVEVSLLHTGQAQPSRLHTSSAAIDAAARGGAPASPPARPPPAAASLVVVEGSSAAAAGHASAAAAAAAAAGGSRMVRRQRKRQRRLSDGSAAGASDGGSDDHHTSDTTSTSSSSRWSRGLQELSSSSGLRGGSSLITLDFAQQILDSIGGRLKLTYPYQFMNAMTGQLELGTNIEVWLPPPAPSAAG